MLEFAGAKLIRHKKHNVYRLADGHKFSQPKTGSDQRGVRNAISDLGKIMPKAGEAIADRLIVPGTPTLAPPPHRRRRRQYLAPNPPKNLSSKVDLPKLDPEPVLRSALPRTAFGSIWEIREYLRDVPSF